MKQVISKPLRFQDGDGFLHGFTTGMVQVKSKFRTAKGGQLTSKIAFLLDKEWSDWMPVWVWVIEHPEGVFVIDTGENARVTEPDYFKQEGAFRNYINKKSFRFKIHSEEEVGPQLTRLGIAEKDLSAVVLTHLHLDHFDGLSYFENTKILVHQLEWEKPGFSLPSLYPKWFEPQILSLESSKDSGFPHSRKLVTSGEIQMVHTPGHTLGHASILLKTNDLHFLLAGDVTYDQDQLLNEVQAGGNQNFKLSRQTLKGIKKYAKEQKLVYLPSHDPQALERMEKEEFLFRK